jgi:hypothetical protein
MGIKRQSKMGVVYSTHNGGMVMKTNPANGVRNCIKL